jgi:hypothetical protein
MSTFPQRQVVLACCGRSNPIVRHHGMMQMWVTGWAPEDATKTTESNGVDCGFVGQVNTTTLPFAEKIWKLFLARATSTVGEKPGFPKTF